MKLAMLHEYRILDHSDRWECYYHGYNKEIQLTYLCTDCGAKHTITTRKDISKPLKFPEELIADCLCGQKLRLLIPEVFRREK